MDADVRILVSGIAQLELGDAKVFHYRRAGMEAEGFLLMTDEGLVAYANSCPHWNVDLDLESGQFFDERTGSILCRNHGALFEPASGLCTRGPCRGQYLRKFAVEAQDDNDRVVVNLESPLELLD